MKSGLEDRNNLHCDGRLRGPELCVSMKSGLEDRNNDVLRSPQHGSSPESQ